MTSRYKNALYTVIDAAIEYEREMNLPMMHKDLALVGVRRRQLFEAVLALKLISHDGRPETK